MKETAVLIPCYNEEQTIGKVVADFRRQLPEANIYVYDNNSTDGTAVVAAAAGAIVRHESAQGKANVIRTMFHEVEARHYVMVDGDDTYPAEAAGEMIRAVESGADMVIGDRLSSTYAAENKRRFHNFGNILVRALVNGCFRSSVTDIMTGYRAFSRRFVKTYPVLASGFEVETEMTIHALDKRLRIVALPVDYRDRPAGSVSKLNTFRDGFKVLLTIFNLIKEYRPLLVLSAVAFGLLVGAALLSMPLLATTSALTFFSGVVLDMIARKSRKQFEVELNLFAILDRVSQA